MPSRKLVNPSSNKKDRNTEIIPYAGFYNVFEDPPNTNLPEGAVAKAINCICKGDGVVSRYGSISYGERFPLIEGRSGYKAHKLGDKIISDSGAIFETGDEGNQFRWDNGYHDEIIEYLDNNEVRVRDDDPNNGTNCGIQGKLNLRVWHNSQEKWVIHLGEEFYIANRELNTFWKVYILSRDDPDNRNSDMIEDGRYAIVNNSAGLFRIIIDNDPPLAYRLNTSVPVTLIETNEDDGEKKHKYFYAYSLAYMDVDGNFNHRESDPIPLIFTESGINKADEDRKDWSVKNTEEEIGEGIDYYQVLDGANLGVRTNPNNWVETDATFGININGMGAQEIIFDCTGALTMEEIINVRMQNALKLYFPSATAEYVAGTGTARIRISSGKVKGGSVSYITAGTTGTDVSGVMQMVAGTGTVSSIRLNAPHIIRDLTLPDVPGSIDPVEKEPFWNRYVVYRSADVGTDGHKYDEKGRRVVNSRDLWIWNKDLRVAGAFFAKAKNGIITICKDQAENGEFEKADVGSVYEFEDGDRVEIVEWLNKYQVRYAYDYYYDKAKPCQAGAIGNGRVIRAAQSGNIVDRISGADFTNRDKLVWWPTGERGIVVRFINSNRLEVVDNTDRDATGITIDPKYRNMNDVIDDEKLLSRASAWACKGRFMREMPLGNIVSLQPGFIITAIRGDNVFSYCQIEAGYRQFVGYYNREYQMVTLDDEIVEIVDFSDRFAVGCKGSWYYGVTNNAWPITISGTQQIIMKMSTPDRIANFGLIDEGAITKLDDDWVRIITNLYEWRLFNGREFGPDLAKDADLGMDNFRRALEGSHPQYASLFARDIGDLAWWKIK